MATSDDHALREYLRDTTLDELQYLITDAVKMLKKENGATLNGLSSAQIAGWVTGRFIAHARHAEESSFP